MRIRDRSIHSASRGLNSMECDGRTVAAIGVLVVAHTDAAEARLESKVVAGLHKPRPRGCNNREWWDHCAEPMGANTLRQQDSARCFPDVCCADTVVE